MPQNHTTRYPLISCSAHQIVRRFLFTLSLFLLLFSTLLGDWAFPLSYAYASSHPHATPVPGSLTMSIMDPSSTRSIPSKLPPTRGTFPPFCFVSWKPFSLNLVAHPVGLYPLCRSILTR